MLKRFLFLSLFILSFYVESIWCITLDTIIHGGCNSPHNAKVSSAFTRLYDFRLDSFYVRSYNDTTLSIYIQFQYICGESPMFAADLKLVSDSIYFNISDTLHQYAMCDCYYKFLYNLRDFSKRQYNSFLLVNDSIVGELYLDLNQLEVVSKNIPNTNQCIDNRPIFSTPSLGTIFINNNYGALIKDLKIFDIKNNLLYYKSKLTSSYLYLEPSNFNSGLYLIYYKVNDTEYNMKLLYTKWNGVIASVFAGADNNLHMNLPVVEITLPSSDVRWFCW